VHTHPDRERFRFCLSCCVHIHHSGAPPSKLFVQVS
jgi:hypothetical protein